MEPQLSQLQEKLKKAKDQLISSESSKRRAQQEAEDAKKQLAAMSAKLEETQKQLDELSDSEELRVQELRKISQDRDRAWESELEALQRQHSMDSSALASAMNEVQRLKIQLERISESEASQARHAESAYDEIHSLRIELTETLELVERLKNQLNDCRESEAQALEEISRAQMELEVVKSTEETLHSQHANAIESYKSLLVELEQSKNRVSSLEELVAELQSDLANSRKISANPSGDIKTVSEIEEAELDDLKHETSQLRAALEAAERRYQDEYLQSTLQIRNAYDLVERAKLESHQIEAELESKLKELQIEAEELKMKLIEKEDAFPKVGDNYEQAEKETELGIELEKSESILEELKGSLLDKEMRLQSIMDENEKLKSEIMKWEIERSKAKDDAVALADEARAAEREALMKLGYLTEEADKSSRKAARVNEQLDAAQAASSDMEAELRRLKVQSDQWRKAAEAATAMLSTGTNGKQVDRTGLFDYHKVGGKLDMTYSEELDDESPKKKNGNMLRKISVLLKKK